MGARRLYIYSWEIIVLPVLKTKVGVAQNGTIAVELYRLLSVVREYAQYTYRVLLRRTIVNRAYCPHKKPTYLVPGIYLPIFTNNIRSSYLVFTMVPRNTVKAVLSLYCAGSDQVHRPVYIYLNDIHRNSDLSPAVLVTSAHVTPYHHITPSRHHQEQRHR